jgi:hypothetical protein
VAIIRTSKVAIQSLAPKAELPTEPGKDPDPFLLLAGPKPPLIVNPIISLIPGAAHDIKQWLKDNGIEMGIDDLALSFWDKNLIVARSSSETIKSIRMLLETEGNRFQPLEVILRVREGMDASSKDLCRLETVVRSGHKLPVSDVDYEADIELTLSDDRNTIETRVDFSGRAGLAGKTISVSFLARTNEDVKVASWTAQEKSVFLCLRVQPVHDEPGISAAQLMELTQAVTKVLGNGPAK